VAGWEQEGTVLAPAEAQQREPGKELWRVEAQQEWDLGSALCADAQAIYPVVGEQAHPHEAPSPSPVPMVHLEESLVEVVGDELGAVVESSLELEISCAGQKCQRMQSQRSESRRQRSRGLQISQHQLVESKDGE
jgi:hypothetical protein